MSGPTPPRPALTADTVVIAGPRDRKHVLLIERAKPPFEGRWALPGGFVDENEAPEEAARRELAEEALLKWTGPLRLVGVFGAPGRDPRGWTVSVAFAGDLGEALPQVSGADDAASAAWHPLSHLPGLAFDHAEIIAAALSVISTCTEGASDGGDTA